MHGLRRILIVDDDPALRHSLQSSSSSTGVRGDRVRYRGSRAGGGRARAFDAILLDVGLPDMDGRELCRRMRRASVQRAIVMLTAADSEADTVMGLDAGANDYITKPFRLSVLLARLRAHCAERAQRRCGSPYRALYVSARRQADGRRQRPQKGAPDRKGNRDPQIPLSRRRPGDRPRYAARRSWGYNAGSRRIPSKPMSTACARRSSAIRRMRDPGDGAGRLPDCCPRPSIDGIRRRHALARPEEIARDIHDVGAAATRPRGGSRSSSAGPVRQSSGASLKEAVLGHGEEILTAVIAEIVAEPQ